MASPSSALGIHQRAAELQLQRGAGLAVARAGSAPPVGSDDVRDGRHQRVLPADGIARADGRRVAMTLSHLGVAAVLRQAELPIAGAQVLAGDVVAQVDEGHRADELARLGSGCTALTRWLRLDSMPSLRAPAHPAATAALIKHAATADIWWAEQAGDLMPEDMEPEPEPQSLPETSNTAPSTEPSSTSRSAARRAGGDAG